MQGRLAADRGHGTLAALPTSLNPGYLMEHLLAVTAIGPDRAGLVRDLSQAITGAGGNILESRMVTLGSEFAILMLVAGNWATTAKIHSQLQELEQGSGLTVTVRETQRRASSSSAPYTIDVVTLDHEGIVFGLSNFFAQRGMEIAEVSTRRYNAPYTGAAMFAVQMTVNVPSDVHVGTLRDEFMSYCDEHNLDALIEPAQR
ncbi:MAG: glycine cleavage system protein R [Chromatiales bacterium]|nr:glycine cleavage system protein R [Chromatiales bacterium]